MLAAPNQNKQKIIFPLCICVASMSKVNAKSHLQKYHAMKAMNLKITLNEGYQFLSSNPRIVLSFGLFMVGSGTG